jgi:hypothetical protein
VRGVRDEVAADPVDLLELGRHRVERARELADLVTGRRSDTLRVVTARHRPRRGDHLPERVRHPVGEELHHRERERGRDERRDEGRQAELAAERHDRDRHADRSHDDDSELELDRAEEVERPVGAHSKPFVSSAYPIPCRVRITSAPSFRRIARTCESTVLSPAPTR